MKKYLCLALLTLSAIVSGCSTTNAPTVAYKTEVATDAAVRTAMTGWGAYVATQHPGTNVEREVLQAFRIYKASQLAAVDATESLSANPTNTAPLDAANNALAASRLDLIQIISLITNSVTPHP